MKICKKKILKFPHLHSQQNVSTAYASNYSSSSCFFVSISEKKKEKKNYF